MDGKIVIGTELDTKQLEKDLKVAKKELAEYEKEAESLTKQKIKAEKDLSGYQEEIKLLSEQHEADLKLAKDDYDRNIEMKTTQKQLDKINQKYAPQIEAYNKIRNKIKQNNVSLELSREKVEEINDKIKKTSTFENITNGMKKINKSIKDTVKNVARWALAIIGIRGAYMAVRNAINVISQGDKKLADDIAMMKTALAYTLEPIVRTLVSWFKQLTTYVAYIVQQLTGKDIFAKARKNLKSGEKSAKSINKSLAGFDEMNVLNNNSSASTDNGNKSDLGLKGFKPPKWLDWILKNKDVILAFLAGILAFLTAFKLGVAGIKALGIGIAIFGIVRAIQGIIKLIKDPSFDNFIQTIEGIAIAVAGVAIAFGAWPVAIGAAVALAVIEIVRYYDKIVEIFNKILEWINGKFRDKLVSIIGPFADLLLAPINGFISMAKGLFEGFYGGIKKIVDGIVLLFKGDFVNGIKTILSGFVSIVTAPLRGIIEGYKGAIDKIATFFSNLWKGFKEKASSAWEGVKKVFSKVATFFKDTFTKAWDGIKALFSKGGKIFDGIKDGIVNAFKTIVNALITGINKVIKTPFDKVNSLLNKIHDVEILKIKPFKSLWDRNPLKVPQIPKLAIGGIVNMPSKGVPVGGALAGERGAEGVIPLTDSQQMELLGEAIGKYITINANITNTMNGRIISRELQKIQNQSSFASNR